VTDEKKKGGRTRSRSENGVSVNKKKGEGAMKKPTCPACVRPREKKKGGKGDGLPRSSEGLTRKKSLPRLQSEIDERRKKEEGGKEQLAT